MGSVEVKIALDKALNRLAKWRSFFASWQLGTRSKEDPECQAVKDHREATVLQRAELTALTALLIEKQVFTEDEFGIQLQKEAEMLNERLEARFPGWEATDFGMAVDLTKAGDAMRHWKP